MKANTKLSRIISDGMHEKSLDYSQLAEALNVSERVVRKWANDEGTPVFDSKFLLLCEILGIPTKSVLSI